MLAMHSKTGSLPRRFLRVSSRKDPVGEAGVRALERPVLGRRVSARDEAKNGMSSLNL